MRIAVLSPYAEHNGKTTVSMLLGLQLSKSAKKVCLCHTKPISASVFQYLSLNNFEDKTSTPSQIVKVLKEGDISADTVSDYDMQYMLNYIIESFPHEHVIVDIDNEDLEFDEKIIAKCDAVVLVVTQDIADAKHFSDNKEKFVKAINGKPLIVVVNKYNSTKGSLSELAHWMGLKRPNNWLVLHENPWITWATNHGKIETVHRLATKKDPRVIEIGPEISKICVTLMKAKVASTKKKGGRN
jgi:hypothetical protein